jgi:CRP-like cAMP-binding protein
MANTPLTPVRAAKPPTDGAGNALHNKILLSLPTEESKRIFPKLELIPVKLHQILHEAGAVIKSGYFLNEGMISILAVQLDGKSVEVGLIGNEGFAGLPLLVGYRSSPTRMIVQGDGTAYRCDAEVLKELVKKCPALELQLHRFGQRLAMQTTQIAACNRLHDVEERLARWIMMTSERISAETLPLTQEFLSQMLGTRRASVTVAAGILQRAGLISYTRGSVKILDKHRLQEAACECYGILLRQLKDWETEAIES